MLHIGDCQVVTVTGDLDMLSASVLYSALATFATDDSVIVDCAGVEFMDSYGLTAILRRRREMLVAGGSLRLRNASSEVLRILSVCGTVSDLLEDGLVDPRLVRFGDHPSVDRRPSLSGG
jgi:anti-anti-sigma factor